MTDKQDYVGVATPNLVYVLMRDREKFDKIGATCTDHGKKDSGHVLTKSVGDHGADEVTVVFQFWVESAAIAGASS